MLKVSQLMRMPVFRPKDKRAEDVVALDAKALAKVGRVRQVVFSPQGTTVVGLLVRRPDVAGMVKRADAFVALDALAVRDEGLVVSRPLDGMDAAAVERLGLDWDACILWTGMDAKTTDGKELGWVSDVEFSPKTGAVQSFFVGDGSVAKSLVGSVVIPGDMLKGYRNGFMLVDPAAATLSLNGGLAAKAGEGYAKAKLAGKDAADKAGKVAGEAVEKGAYGLGRVIGKAKRALVDEDPVEPAEGAGELPAAADAEEEHVEYAPVKKKSSKSSSGTKKKKKSANKQTQSAAKAVGKQLKRTRGMFGSFMDEYKKASK